MHPLSIKMMTWSLGLYTAVTCVLCGLIAPQGLHATQLHEWMLQGFTWLSPGSFVLGQTGALTIVVKNVGDIPERAFSWEVSPSR